MVSSEITESFSTILFSFPVVSSGFFVHSSVETVEIVSSGSFSVLPSETVPSPVSSGMVVSVVVSVVGEVP